MPSVWHADLYMCYMDVIISVIRMQCNLVQVVYSIGISVVTSRMERARDTRYDLSHDVSWRQLACSHAHEYWFCIHPIHLVDSPFRTWYNTICRHVLAIADDTQIIESYYQTQVIRSLAVFSWPLSALAIFLTRCALSEHKIRMLAMSMGHCCCCCCCCFYYYYFFIALGTLIAEKQEIKANIRRNGYLEDLPPRSSLAKC